MIVVFEETGEERKIVGYCKVCRAEGEPQVVSPSGIVHEANYGMTLCGHDATSADWWWRV